MDNLKSWNDPSLLFSFAFFFYIQNHQFFWKNLLVNEFRNPMGGGLLGISKKIISIFKTLQKMLTKFGQFKKLKCPNFVTIFCRVLKMKIFFFDIPSYPPPIAVWNSLTNQFFQKKMMFLYIFNNKTIAASLYRDIHPGDSWPYVVTNTTGVNCSFEISFKTWLPYITAVS